jgi:hypothetical protein
VVSYKPELWIKIIGFKIKKTAGEKLRVAVGAIWRGKQICRHLEIY